MQIRPLSYPSPACPSPSPAVSPPPYLTLPPIPTLVLKSTKAIPFPKFVDGSLTALTASTAPLHGRGALGPPKHACNSSSYNHNVHGRKSGVGEWDTCKTASFGYDWRVDSGACKREHVSFSFSETKRRQGSSTGARCSSPVIDLENC